MISITASHNDVSWNGLKLLGPGGRHLTSAEGREVMDLWHQGEFRKAPYDALGVCRDADNTIDRYLGRLERAVDRDAIAAAGLRVIVDATNGSGAMVIHELCRRFGVELIPVSCEPTGVFPHPPDPSAANLAQVAAIMRPVRAHVGFGFSSDCERVSLVTELGQALGTPATLPLMAASIVPRAGGKPTVVASAGCDSRVRTVTARHGGRVVECGVSNQAVMEHVELEDAVLGGEWSGGVAWADFARGFDGLAVMARLLQAVVSAGSASALAEALPRVHTRAAAVPCPVDRAYSAVADIRSRAVGRAVDLDGVKVEREDSWYYVRVSHTEPVVRALCEAPTAEEADELIQTVVRRVREAARV
jgi:phosphomannomutase